MKAFENIVLLGYAILLGLIALFIIFRYLYFRRTKQSRTPIGQEKSPTVLSGILL